MNTQELGQAFNAAQLALRDKRDTYNKYIRDRQEQERQRIFDAANMIYGEDLKTLGDAADVAYKAHRAALDADARAGVGAKFTPGTLFEQWKSPYTGIWSRDVRKRQKTGKRARYVAVTKDTVLPANQSYRAPKLGEYFLQVVKKDGSAGVAFVDRSEWNTYYPEGVDGSDDSAQAAAKTWQQQQQQEEAEHQAGRIELE